MCYDDNARPPLPPSEAGAAHGEDIVLEAADGNRFAAYAAQPGKPTGAQILIFPDVRGLHQFYKELALRFAEIGKAQDRKSTRLNSSHVKISYAVFCLKKKKKKYTTIEDKRNISINHYINLIV